MPAREVRTEIDISATAPQVWRVLTDFALYPDWNPFLRKAAGELAEGGELCVTTSLFGLPLPFRLRIDSIRENRGMRWLGQTLTPGLLDGRHYFEIHQLSPETVRFVQYEVFSGFLLLPAWPLISPVSRQGFAAMNRALKARVERMRGGVAGETGRRE